MKKILCVALLGVLFVGCSKNNPKYISEDYIKALEEKDFRRAKSYIYVPSSTQSYLSAKDTDEKVLKDFNELQNELEKIGGVKKFRIVKNTELSDTLRELQVECEGKNGQFVDKTFYAINIDGKWKLIQSIK